MGDMEVDWIARGQQNLRVRRACSDVEPAKLGEVTCTSGSTDSAYQYKDCQQVWEAQEELGANKETGDIEEALGDNKVSSCHVCYSNSLLPDTDDECKDVPSPDNQQQCPPYANSACFKSVSEHAEGNKLVMEI